MSQIKVVEQIETHTLCSPIFLRKSCRLRDNVEICDTARQATDDNKRRRMRFECWTNTHAEYVIDYLLLFQRQQWLHKRVSVLTLYVHCLSCLCSMNSFIRSLDQPAHAHSTYITGSKTTGQDSCRPFLSMVSKEKEACERFAVTRI